MCYKVNFLAAGYRHPKSVLHGGDRRLLPQHHRRGHHHGGDAGHVCRHYRLRITGWRCFFIQKSPK